MPKKKTILKLKYWGSREAVEIFREYLDDNFLGVLSKIKHSTEGGCHAFATIEVSEE